MQPLGPTAVPLMHFSTLVWALAVAFATGALSTLVLHVWRRTELRAHAEPDGEAGARAVPPTGAAAVTFDERGVLESINPAGEALFGIAEGWMGWVHIQEILPSIGSPEFGAPGEEGSRPGGLAVQTLGRHVSGALVPVEVALTRMEIAGRVHHCALVRDAPAMEGSGLPVLVRA
jgi:hypothetical protein